MVEQIEAACRNKVSSRSGSTQHLQEKATSVPRQNSGVESGFLEHSLDQAVSGCDIQHRIRTEVEKCRP